MRVRTGLSADAVFLCGLRAPGRQRGKPAGHLEVFFTRRGIRAAGRMRGGAAENAVRWLFSGIFAEYAIKRGRWSRRTLCSLREIFSAEFTVFS